MLKPILDFFVKYIYNTSDKKIKSKHIQATLEEEELIIKQYGYDRYYPQSIITGDQHSTIESTGEVNHNSEGIKSDT